MLYCTYMNGKAPILVHFSSKSPNRDVTKHVIRDMLTSIVCRLACWNSSSSLFLLRPILFSSPNLVTFILLSTLFALTICPTHLAAVVFAALLILVTVAFSLSLPFLFSLLYSASSKPFCLHFTAAQAMSCQADCLQKITTTGYSGLEPIGTKA